MSSEQPSIVADIVNTLSSGTPKDSNFVSYNLIKKIIDTTIVNNNYEQVIVFMVGGGSLAEFEYIDHLLLQNRKNVLILYNYIVITFFRLSMVAIHCIHKMSLLVV